MQRTRLAQSRLGLGVEILPFDADARAEQRQHADAVEEWRGGGQPASASWSTMPDFEPPRRDRVEGGSGAGVLGMDADQVGAGIGELLDLAVQDGVGHHQVDMQRLRRGAARDGDEVGKKQQRRREMAVGDVDVEDVGERLDTRDVVGEAAEVRRPQRHLGQQPVFRQARRANLAADGSRQEILSNWRQSDEECRQRCAELGDVARRCRSPWA